MKVETKPIVAERQQEREQPEIILGLDVKELSKKVKDLSINDGAKYIFKALTDIGIEPKSHPADVKRLFERVCIFTIIWLIFIRNFHWFDFIF
jgi:hypothetical protein